MAAARIATYISGVGPDESAIATDDVKCRDHRQGRNDPRAGDIYFGDGRPGLRVIFINASTGMLKVFAGTGGSGYSGDGGPAVHAQFGIIASIALGPSGELYVADARYNVVRVVGPDPDHTISTLAGTGGPGYSGDGGPANKAQLNSPAGLAVDKEGNVFHSGYGKPCH